MENPLTVICRFISNGGKKVVEVEMPREKLMNIPSPFVLEHDSKSFQNHGGLHTPDFPFLSFREIPKA